jgi:hypothetical protein
MRKSLLLIAVLAATPAFAQTTVEREGQLDPRKNQKIEHLRTEDKDNRIDEVRVGGQTQSAMTWRAAGPATAATVSPSASSGSGT